MASQSEVTHVGKETKMTKKDAMADMNARLAKVEIAMAEELDKAGEWGQRMEELESGREELRGEMQGALNMVSAVCRGHVKTLEETLVGMIAGLEEKLAKALAELKETKEELAICKKAIAQGASNVVSPTTPRVDVPKPRPYGGSRNAKELDNFLWSLEQYFKALGIVEDAKKMETTTLYLDNTAMVWWRRRSVDIERGTCKINTWAEFKKELKRQFYPVNAEDEARGRLRRLQHKGSIQDYVKEFTKVLLEIPDYPDKEALFAFMDGLQGWAKREIHRHGAHDLATAIAIAESLIELQRDEKSKPPKEKSDNGNGGGDNHHESKEHKFEKGKWISKAPIEPKDGGKRPTLKCFFCEGPHRARECPTKAKLAAMIQEMERQDDEEKESPYELRIGSM
ncbi:Synaptobrevin protein [Dioscorea alata]|uniref:Synaptobrevin protein n=1 Tax=Dioscorea alata TaxID=55571 RepID=A0ACB7VAI8_DIOAL|nr:Synaptobrevin protein [Dioscorea alata]